MRTFLDWLYSLGLTGGGPDNKILFVIIFEMADLKMIRKPKLFLNQKSYEISRLILIHSVQNLVLTHPFFE